MLGTVLFTRLLLMPFPGAAAGEASQALRAFFKEQVGLSEEEIARLRRGEVIAKVLPSQRADEIVVFGAVWIEARPERYSQFVFDFDRLRRLPGYLGVQRLSDPPALAELQGFTLEPEDIKSLKTCRPDRCGVQLSARAIQELQQSLDWTNWSAVTSRVNNRIQQMALEILQSYRLQGNRALGIYQDVPQAFDVGAELSLLLKRAEPLPLFLPELSQFVLDYPQTAMQNVQSVFYWEKVDFGLKPTLRLNHAFTYQSNSPRGPAYVAGIKQLYASHYFKIALDVSECIPEIRQNAKPGFYLISLRGSTLTGLTGFKGSFVRRMVVSRVRSAQEKGLAEIKKVLESQ
jgi:hypothetical protein